MSDKTFCRRSTIPVHIGKVTVGGDNPIRLQSMTNTSTLDTDASVAQVKSIAAAGGEIVRLTAQGVSHAANLAEIRRKLTADGYDVPLVADIHFNPAAAFEAAKHVEKVRINPGNFVDPGRTFVKLTYTDDEYAAELQRIADRLVPLLKLCREHGTALRIGVNHGSLSDRIMSRYGDTPAGMTESALEFLRVCRANGFDDVVVSIKASNVGVMVQTVRMLADAMDAEGLNYPLHLGVTEAGDGEDGRIKSAAGIGTLLAEGIGDTIRVSLSEDPAAEIPVARMLVEHIGRMTHNVSRVTPRNPQPVPLIVGLDTDADRLAARGFVTVRAGGADALFTAKNAVAAVADAPVLLHLEYSADLTPEQLMVAAATDFGSILLDGYADAVAITAPQLSPDQRNALLLNILQATRRRISKTEYIACPGCGRTLFDLQGTLARVKAATSHLKGLKIGVMGCIVNGPGEMADADYGYVGAAKGKVSLYKGKTCISRNIDTADAIDRLIGLIKENGDWHDPE